MRLTSRDDWDTDAENEEDGASRNPYAAWEWASTLRSAGDFGGAARTHKLASEAFDDIGDKVSSSTDSLREKSGSISNPHPIFFLDSIHHVSDG